MQHNISHLRNIRARNINMCGFMKIMFRNIKLKELKIRE